MTTVLAQDHFYSDFLSLHVTFKTTKKSVRMNSRMRFLGELYLKLSCRFDDIENASI